MDKGFAALSIAGIIDKAKEGIVQSSIPIDTPLTLSILIGDAFHSTPTSAMVSLLELHSCAVILQLP